MKSEKRNEGRLTEKKKSSHQKRKRKYNVIERKEKKKDQKLHWNYTEGMQ